MEMIVCKQVHFNYVTRAGSVSVLRGVDLRIERGEHVSIVGSSGAGKTTLLRLCAALALPSSGTVKIGENTLTSELRGAALARFRREQVGLIFQQFSLLPALSGLENIILPLLPYAPQAVLRKRAISLLAEVGLENRGEHYPDQLSGGEQQRIAIARSLIASPPLLLADEPTGSLDSVTGQQVMKLLHRLCQEHHCTLVVVTHDPHVAEQADRSLHMQDGRFQS